MWIVLAALPPLFWGLSNLADQYMVRVHFRVSVIPFMALSEFTGIILLPVFALVRPDVLSIAPLEALKFMAIGVVYWLCIIPYLIALQEDDSSVIVPVFQLVPVLTLLMGWAFLGETISTRQFAGMMMVMAASVAIVWDFQLRRLKWRALGLVLLACAIGAAYTIFLRVVAPATSSVIITFWQMAGWFFCGMALLVVHGPTRRQVFSAIKSSRGKIFFVSWVPHVCDGLASFFLTMALAVAPAAALVNVVAGVQSLYVIAFAAVLALFFPGIFDRSAWDRLLVLKLGCAAFMLAGLYVLMV